MYTNKYAGWCEEESYALFFEFMACLDILSSISKLTLSISQKNNAWDTKTNSAFNTWAKGGGILGKPKPCFTRNLLEKKQHFYCDEMLLKATIYYTFYTCLRARVTRRQNVAFMLCKLPETYPIELRTNLELLSAKFHTTTLLFLAHIFRETERLKRVVFCISRKEKHTVSRIVCAYM